MDNAPRIESSSDLRQLLYERSRDFRDVAPVCLRPQPGEKWLASSALQKAIRRGNREIAALAAETLLAVAPDYVWRRLPTICLEDIGLANRLLCAAALEASRSSVFRHRLGDRAVAHCLIDAACTSVKCRALTDLLMLDSSKPPRAHDWYRSVDRMNLSFIDSYLARYGFSAAGLGLQVPKLLRMMPAEVRIETNPSDEPGDELVGDLPACTFDKHVAVGKRSYAYFAKACKPVREFFQRNPALDPLKSIAITMFIVESAVLDRSLHWDGRDELLAKSIARDFTVYGLTNQQGKALQSIAQANRAKLNECRRRIVGA